MDAPGSPPAAKPPAKGPIRKHVISAEGRGREKGAWWEEEGEVIPERGVGGRKGEEELLKRSQM